MAITLPLSELGNKLRGLAERYPKAVEAGLRETARALGGEFVQAAIATTAPHLPVDQGQYKAGWRTHDVPGGATVTNITKQAVWIERGRMPGPIGREGLLALEQWVRRKGIHKDAVKTALAKTGKKRFSKEERAATTDAAISGIARAIAHKIESKGYEPRWVLKRAIHALIVSGKIDEIVDAHVATAAGAA